MKLFIIIPHPWAALLLSIFVAAISNTTVDAANTAALSPRPDEQGDMLISNLMKWLLANGAYINPKLQIRHIIPNDPSSPRAVYATETLDKDDIVCKIPWKLMITPSSYATSLSDFAQCETIDNVYKEITKDENEITPYGKYLLSQPRGYTPAFWSEAGQDLLWEMTNKERLPPVWVKDTMEYWVEECGGNKTDPMHMFASMLVNARADYQYLTPFYDMMNHDNGKFNVLHRYDSSKGDITEQTGFELYVGKAIQKNDQLLLSYNQEKNSSSDWYDWFGTPEMFVKFGFVEDLPQRWLFDFARIKFDLEWVDGRDEHAGDYNVKFLVPPSKEGMDMLRKELAYLDSFEKTALNNNSHEGVSEGEMRSLREYYNALHFAIELALDSSATILVDDVWKMNSDWWVTEDGSLVAADDESHSVRPSRLHDSEEL